MRIVPAFFGPATDDSAFPGAFETFGSLTVLTGPSIVSNARVIDDDPHGDWQRLLPVWERKEPAIVSFLKVRVALPLFFERALIEITPRRAFYWADGDAQAAPIVTELDEEAI